MTEEFELLLADHVRGRALDRLLLYAELVERWGARHNLVRFSCRRELVERHLVESLSGCEVLGPRGRLLDVGSGAGLPGVPVLAARPGWSGVLLEPRAKRWAFLRAVIRELALDATAERQRYESYAGSGFDAVTVRAVGGHAQIVEWSRSRLARGGRVMLWTTEKGVAELRSLCGWRVVSSPLPGLERGMLAQLTPCFT